MQAQVITTREGFDALASEWNALLEESRARTIFLTWEWVSAWLEAVCPDAQLLVIVVRDGTGRLCGLAPFYRTTMTLLRVMRWNWLRVLGDAESGSEYVNVIARSDVEQEANRSILHYLEQKPQLWDALWLPSMGPLRDPCTRLEAIAGEAGFQCRSRTAEFARIELPDSFEDYLLSLPRKIRYQMRRGHERLESDYRAVLVTCKEVDELDRSLEDLFWLHQARWTDRGQPGVFSRPHMRAFYRAFGRPMLKQGWLRLDTLRVDGRAVAAQIGFSYHGVFYELQRGIDPAFPNVPAGLGAALRCMVIRRCMEEGIRTYDFLGEYTIDKGRAGAERPCGRDLIVVRPSLRNSILFRSNVWPTGRYLTEKRSRTPRSAVMQEQG